MSIPYHYSFIRLTRKIAVYRHCDDHLGLHRPFKRTLPTYDGNVRCRLCLVSWTFVRAVGTPLTGESSGAAIWGYAVPGGMHGFPVYQCPRSHYRS